MKHFTSVHVLSKENTNLGVKFLDSCFTSLEEAQYPNEIVVIDNGSFDPIFDLYSTWKPKFKAFDCEMKVIKSESKDFATLRNECIQHTSPNCTYFHWIDTDEVYYPEDLDILKNEVLRQVDNLSQCWSYFYHFMINPFMIQADELKNKKLKDLTLDYYRCSKDNMFGFHKGIQWIKEKKVHEKVTNKKPGMEVWSQCEYLHYGYCRQQWRTVLKWLHYDYIEKGHVGHYKVENVTIDENGVEVPHDHPNAKIIQKEYLRDWRAPDKDFLWDRRLVSTPFPNPVCREYLPQGAINLISSCQNEADWVKYINELDDSTFLERWIQKYKECNNSWTGTLDWVVEEMNKIDWKI